MLLLILLIDYLRYDKLGNVMVHIDEGTQQKIVRVIKALIPDIRVYLFIARTHGAHVERPDIDVALDAGRKLPRRDVGEIRDMLNASHIPFKINVLDLNAIPEEMREILAQEDVIGGLTLRHTTLIKILAALGGALSKLNQYKSSDYYYEELRDGVIKRFEYAADTFWRFLKEYLNKKHGIEPIASPKSVLKSCFDLELLAPDEYKNLIDMIDMRNLSAHAYDIALAQEISQDAEQYYKIMQAIIERIQLS